MVIPCLKMHMTLPEASYGADKARVVAMQFYLKATSILNNERVFFSCTLCKL